jgi:hypothetical protein
MNENNTIMTQTLVRCGWVNLANPRYVQYHDHEWGVPCHDERRLFEMLNLEGAQAGLSWTTRSSTMPPPVARRSPIPSASPRMRRNRWSSWKPSSSSSTNWPT